MPRRKSLLVLYIIVFASVTNLAAAFVKIYALPLMPLLYILATLVLLSEILTSPSYPMTNYQNQAVYVVIFFFLTYLTIGLLGADIDKAFDNEIYLLLTGFFVFHMVLLVVQKKEEVDGILLVILLCGPVLALQGVYQYLNQDSVISINSTFRAGGWWTDPNTYAFVLNLVYLISFYFQGKKEKLLQLASYSGQLSAALGIFISLSRGGIIIFMLITLLNWRNFRRHKIYTTAIILVVIFIFMIFAGIVQINTLQNFDLQRFLISSDENKNDFTNGRLTAALSGLTIYSRHPLLGAGFGNTLDYAETINYIRLHSHNMFIEILTVSGPLPFLGYLFMLIYLFLFTRNRSTPQDNLSRLFGNFIIILSAMGLFSHYLLYMKPVWILLALIPVYINLVGGRKIAFGDDNKQI